MLWINRASGISDFDGSRVVLTALELRFQATVTTRKLIAVFGSGETSRSPCGVGWLHHDA